MKPFITEAQLALFKYQAGGKYFNCPMSYIAQQEFVEFSRNNRTEDLIFYFSHFWNREIKKDIWEISFSDNSSLLIRKVFKNGKIIFQSKSTDSTDNSDFDVIFS
ncbi:DUF1132 family protein [Neisseria sp. 20925_1_37]|uniref:DUF1132 family protein n=1 Tax=Neisseria sp. 20925_1_37 TaxID=3003683 RepID=UPI00352DC227